MPASLSGSGSSSLHTGSHHASPISASPGGCSSQQNPITVCAWGPIGPTQYPVPPLPPSNGAALYPAQGSPRTCFYLQNVSTNYYSGMQSLALCYPLHTQSSTASPPSTAPHVSIDPNLAIGVSHGMPTTGQAFPYGPTASAIQPGPSAHPSGLYAPIDPREVYETLIGTSVSSGTHIKDDKGQTNILFVFGDLSVRTEGTFRLRLRLSNIGE
jgi:hypothetical protein